MSAKLVPTFASTGSHVVSVTNPYGRILGFLDWSRYFFFQVAPQLYSRGWVDPVPDPLLLRKSGSAGNRTRAPRSVARNSVTIVILAIIIRSVFYSKHDVLETGFYIRLQVELTQLGIIDRTSLRNVVFEIEDRTMYNVQNCHIYINMPSSQTYRT
jgi:hypothetical protein